MWLVERFCERIFSDVPFYKEYPGLVTVRMLGEDSDFERKYVSLSPGTDKVIHGKSWTRLILLLWSKNLILVQVMPGACYLYSMVLCTRIDTIPHTLVGRTEAT